MSNLRAAAEACYQIFNGANAEETIQAYEEVLRPFLYGSDNVSAVLQNERILELAVMTGMQWHLLLKSGVIFETTPDLRDALSRLAGEIISHSAAKQLQDATPFDFSPWKPPFHYESAGSNILDSRNRLILDIRGWGFLTGKGSEALRMDEATACSIQDALGEFVTRLLNLTSVHAGNDNHLADQGNPKSILAPQTKTEEKR